MEPSTNDFHHPYQPYDIQIQFMNELYRCIERGNVGIFESPTGTGKSLSLICASLTWIRDNKSRALESPLGNIDAGDDPEWMIEAERQERRDTLLNQRRELEQRLSIIRKEAIHRKSKMSNYFHDAKKQVG